MASRPPWGDRERGPVAPKPYTFISFPDQIVRDEVPGHHVIKPDLLAGTLAFSLRTLTPLFVSSGQVALSEDLRLPPGNVAQAHYRINGRPAIPASSLKGAVRSVVEAVSASCLGVTRVRPYDLPKTFKKPCSRHAACPACILFGMGGNEAYLGQVRFEDALLTDGQMILYRLPALYRPRPNAPIYRDERRQYKGRKFYRHGRPRAADKGGQSEVIRNGSTLTGQITFTNLSDDQLGLLVYAMGLGGQFRLKLGGGKPACLGSLHLQPLRLTLTDSRQAFLGDADAASERVWEGDNAIAQVRDYVAGARRNGYILAQQAGELEQLLRYDSSQMDECPTGVY